MVDQLVEFWGHGQFKPLKASATAESLESERVALGGETVKPT
jgi:hypothetical protein